MSLDSEQAPVARGRGVVLPIGYQAMRDRGSPTTPPRVRVRLGTEYVALEGRADVGMWLLAHGSWSVRRSGWSRADVLTAAVEREIPDPEATLERLGARGLVAVAETAPHLRELAETHRLVALMTCAGDIGDGIALAVADSQTRVRLEPREFAVWMHTPAAATIWDSAVRGADDGSMDAFHPFRSPDELVGGIIAATQFLVSRGGAYLDLPMGAR